MNLLEALVPLFCSSFLHAIIPAACAQTFVSHFSSLELTKINRFYSVACADFTNCFAALIYYKVMNKAAIVSVNNCIHVRLVVI